ncbi:hypothetical protein JCM11251_001651 [Rhodosporidiobolus azoricus]
MSTLPQPPVPALHPKVPPPPLPPSPWQPHHLDEPPLPPPPDTREEQLAQLAAQEKLGHDGKRQRVRARRTVDPYGGVERWKIYKSIRTSHTPHGDSSLPFIRGQPSYLIDLLPAQAYSNPSTSICSRYAHTSTNKLRCPVNIVTFTPDARRILTGSTSGEFTLWNGLTFNFETILQAHDSAVRALSWSHSGSWLLSADSSGLIKYFQPNMNNLQVFQGHNEAVRDCSWAPNDERFVTGGDDGVIKVWNFERMKEERVLTGHGWDVKAVKWHPTKGLLASGSKDNLVKFWDPRTGNVLTTLHGHKNTVQALSWSPNGHLVATASRDQLVKVFDIRAMKELVTLRGHKKEVCSVAWHPFHSDLLVSGGSEGSILHWSLPDPAPKEQLDHAHDSNVWSLAYHPLGHLVVSASNDHTTRFWSRGRPGVRTKGDRFHVGRENASVEDGGRVVESGGGGSGGGPGGARNGRDEDDDFLPGFQHRAPAAPPPPPPGFTGALPNFSLSNNRSSSSSGNSGPLPGFGGANGFNNLNGGGGGGGAPPPPPPGFGNHSAGPIPGMGGMGGGEGAGGGGGGGFIPGFGRAPHMGGGGGGGMGGGPPPGYGGGGGGGPPPGFGGGGGGGGYERAPLPPGFGGGGGGQGEGQQYGMRRNGPLPSQQESLERYAGPNAGGQRRWGGRY